MEWHHLTHILLVGTTDGDTWMFKIPSGDTKTFQSHGVPCTVGKIIPDGRCYNFSSLNMSLSTVHMSEIYFESLF